MTDFEQDWIERRAYALWEEEGYPAGRDSEHWDKAKEEFDALVAAKAIDPDGPVSETGTTEEIASPPVPDTIVSPDLPKRRTRKTTPV